jgi:ankyrin repeat protein
MARVIITRCLKSYDINAFSHGASFTQYGYTPLSAAASYDDEEMLRLLCERADVLVNKQEGFGYTALHKAFEALLTASEMGQVGCMRILLDVGKADVHDLSGSSRTAFHGATYYGHLEAAALLIERGAKVNLVDGYGGTPLDLAHQAIRNSTEMIALLKSKGAKRASELPQPST